MRLPLYLRLLGVGKLYGYLMLSKRVSVRVTGNHLEEQPLQSNTREGDDVTASTSTEGRGIRVSARPRGAMLL